MHPQLLSRVLLALLLASGVEFAIRDIAVGRLANAAPDARRSAPNAPALAQVVRVDGGFVRGIAGGGRVTSAYFVLRNPSATAVRLVGAESPRAGRIEIHAHDMQGGMMRMRQRAFIDVPAHGSVRFAPGGLHLMLMELRGELVDREPVQLTLLFADGARQALTIPVCSVMRASCP